MINEFDIQTFLCNTYMYCLVIHLLFCELLTSVNLIPECDFPVISVLLYCLLGFIMLYVCQKLFSIFKNSEILAGIKFHYINY